MTILPLTKVGLSSLEAAVREATRIEDVVMAAADQHLRRLAAEAGWAGRFDWEDRLTAVWLPEWEVPGGGPQLELRITAAPEWDRFDLTTLCGASTRSVAFETALDRDALGGLATWRHLARRLNAESPWLSESGWIFDVEYGTWRVPFALDPNELSRAIEGRRFESAFRPIDVAFDTFRIHADHLTRLLHAVQSASSAAEVSERAIDAILRDADIEGLIGRGAPSSEYDIEASAILEAILDHGAGLPREDALTTIVAAVWGRFFGYATNDLARQWHRFEDVSRKIHALAVTDRKPLR